MNPHPFLDDDLAERAALLAIGALSEDEARRLRLHAKLCTTCANEIESLESVARELALAAPTLRPGPGLFERIRERIRGVPNDAGGLQVWKRWTHGAPAADGSAEAAQDGLTLVRGARGDADFQPTSIAGIEVRQLFVDEAHDRATMLVRMAPGTRYPPHRHGGEEECFVLQGELTVGELHMRAGDYQRAEAGSVHAVQATDEGCLLLITSSLHDEMI